MQWNGRKLILPGFFSGAEIQDGENTRDHIRHGKQVEDSVINAFDHSRIGGLQGGFAHGALCEKRERNRYEEQENKNQFFRHGGI